LLKGGEEGFGLSVLGRGLTAVFPSSFVSVSVAVPVTVLTPAALVIPSLCVPFFSAVLFPVLDPLPPPPVLFEVRVGNIMVPMSGRDVTVIRGQVEYRNGNVLGSEVDPAAVVGGGAIPMSLMRPIPVTAVEKYVRTHVRGIIDVRSRYDDDRRWRMDREGRRRDIDADVDIDLGRNLADSACAGGKCKPCQ
jgi:hypothetical protein